MTPPSDFSPGAWRRYVRRPAEMKPSERVEIGVALWEAPDSLQRAAAGRMYPDASEEEITYRIAVTRFGETLARKAYRR